MMRSWMGLISGIKVNSPDCPPPGEPGPAYGGYFRAVRRLVQKYEELELVFPVHLNPVVRELAASVLGDMDRVHLIEPWIMNPLLISWPGLI